MSYQRALEANGHTVLEFEMFGSYQGNWAAILADGGVVIDYFGSCIGCDALQAYESALDSANRNDYSYEMTNADYAEFGKDYIPQYNYEDVLAAETWDSDSTERAKWIKEQLIKHGFIQSQ